MLRSPTIPLELLAPAGSVDVFQRAVEAGANAVYIGAPSLNARALAKKFSWREMAAMVGHGHRYRVKVYVAMNSLMKEEEIPLAVETLAVLDTIGVDGVILQDLGIYHLVRRYFPGLRLHASTLMGAHNSLAVRQLAEMGFSRVVLARELTLAEIGEIRKGTDVELEAFVHGAMCYSYSGLCLFSSFQGGKSGLRGACVQPCRRRYAWQGKGGGAGYFFSMNDLEAIGLLPELAAAGVTSFKIEGRMRSASYVAAVVSAYRLVLDNLGDRQALDAGIEMLTAAMGRKTTPGYFLTPQPQAAISHQHSGNIGLFLGRIERVAGADATLTLKGGLMVGDRLRAHHEKSGERSSFALKKIWRSDKSVETAAGGDRVRVETQAPLSVGDSLYKVDVRDSRDESLRLPPIVVRPGDGRELVDRKRVGAILDRIEQALGQGNARRARSGGVTPPAGGKGKQRGRRPSAGHGEPQGKRPPPVWVRVEDLRAVRFLKSTLFDRLVVGLGPASLAQFYKLKKHLRPHLPRMVWALPPVIEEGSRVFYQESVTQLHGQGFRSWQLGHLGQLTLFDRLPDCHVFWGYTFNVLNSQALAALRELGFAGGELSVESDRRNLQAVCRSRGQLEMGMLAYGRLPIFISRLASDAFRFNQHFVSPKGEKFVLEKRWGQVLAISEKTYSLLPWLGEFPEAGIDYAVLDLSGMTLRTGGLESLLRASGRPPGRGQSSFNFNLGLR